MKVVLLLVSVLLMSVAPSFATPASTQSSSKVKKNTSIKAVKKGEKEKKKSKSSKKTAASPVKYKIKSGDNFYVLAKRFGMKLSDLQRLNGIKGDRLKIGQTILVYMKKSAAQASDEVVEETGKVISQIALPNDDGLFNDAIPDAGVEPIARTYLSIPYRYGAQSRKSTDCSGFVQQVFREFDITLPRTAREQYRVGMKVDRSNLSSGDLLFFRTRARKKYPTHVGIYLGNGKMIHASSRQHKVVISDVNHPYYVKRYVGAKRTATFLPGEIDLEMLARQVTGLEYDTPLGEAISGNVVEEAEDSPIVQASLSSETCTIQDLNSNNQVKDDQEGLSEDADAADQQDVAEEGDDIDNEVEPDAVEVVPLAPAAPVQ